MTNTFESVLKATLNNETILTENSANAFKTAGNSLLDINFAVSSLRGRSKEAIEKMFSDAFYINNLLAVKWLFFARDIRGGMGERRLFRICLSWLANVKPELVKKLIPLCAEYGRWDDLFYAGFEGELWDNVIDLVAKQLESDLDNANNGKPISLLAKWMPSTNTSSPTTRDLAKKLRRSLGMDEKTYRKNLSFLRSKLRLVEVDASANNWSNVDYNSVPSMANLKYKNAFLKHDEERRKKYLADLEKPESGAKINASVTFPCDIVHKYASQKNGYYLSSPFVPDPALEAMWKALPNYVAGNNDGSTIVVCDTSGSMETQVGETSMTALDVAHSLAIYFSEKLTGPFKNKWITFSNRPQYVDMSQCQSLADKLTLAYNKAEVANTDLKKTFMLILKIAVDNNLKQEDLPSNILICSDMHFDAGTYHYQSYDAHSCSLMKEISDEFAKHGYKIPKCVWWNICGGYNRSTPVPVQQMENGCALVSGFSPSIAKMVFSGKTDPYETLLDALNVERYQPIEDAFKSCEN